MPVPPEEQYPEAQASGSNSQPRAGGNKSIESLLDQLSESAEAVEQREEDGEGSDGEEEEEEGSKPPVAGDGNVGKSGKNKKKKKKKKSKAAMDKLKGIVGPGAIVPKELVNAVRNEMKKDPANNEQVTDDDIKKALKAFDMMKILEGKEALGNKSNTKDIGEHKFWKTQPVPQTLVQRMQSAAEGSSAHVIEDIEEGPIDDPKTVDEVRKEPLALPNGYEWHTIDINNASDCKEVETLLSENYVEDEDASFRLNYSKEFLRWALTPPGYVADWHIGVRVASNHKLVAFISGIPVDVQIRKNKVAATEINFLCAHKKLRHKRMAPVLIKEVTRRVNLRNIWQAVYTAGVVLPTPVGVCRYFHRNLNVPKLIDIGFAPLRRGETISRLVRKYALPEQPSLAGYREMEEKDVAQVGELLRKYLARFELNQRFDSDDEVRHWFLSEKGTGEYKPGYGRDGQVVWSYVVEDPNTNKITDFISFYSLPSLVMKRGKNENLGTAYLFYYASDVVFNPSGSEVTQEAVKGKLTTRLNGLVKDAMIIAKGAGFDVFNALTLMDNNLFLSEQMFGPGDGYLNYYLYNWKCAPIEGALDGVVTKKTSEIGVVML